MFKDVLRLSERATQDVDITTQDRRLSDPEVGHHEALAGKTPGSVEEDLRCPRKESIRKHTERSYMVMTNSLTGKLDTPKSLSKLPQFVIIPWWPIQ